MATVFLDSSGLVKRYVAETGSPWVQTLTDPASGNTLALARITGPEIISAVTRRLRRGATTPADAAAAIAAFRTDFVRAYFLIDVTSALTDQAMNLAERHGLRGYDSVQLAAALELRDQCLVSGVPGPLFVTADAELNAAARAEGVAVEDPNRH